MMESFPQSLHALCPDAPCLRDVGSPCWPEPVEANRKPLLVPQVTTIKGLRVPTCDVCRPQVLGTVPVNVARRVQVGGSYVNA